MGTYRDEWKLLEMAIHSGMHGVSGRCVLVV